MTEVEQLRTDLRAIKENIARWGWTRGTTGEDGGPRCVMGAANDVIGTCSTHWRSDDGGELDKRRTALHDYLAVFAKAPGVSWWNDRQGRTVQDVFDLIDAALASLPAPAATTAVIA